MEVQRIRSSSKKARLKRKTSIKSSPLQKKHQTEQFHKESCFIFGLLIHITEKIEFKIS